MADEHDHLVAARNELVAKRDQLNNIIRLLDELLGDPTGVLSKGYGGHGTTRAAILQYAREHGRPFNRQEAERGAAERGGTKTAVRQFLGILAREGQLVRVQRGVYEAVPDATIDGPPEPT